MTELIVGRIAFTPGPWSATKLDGGSWWIERKDIPRSVASLISYPEDEANARLIAAAPDMLAALYEVAHHADDECGFMGLVRAAIAKAEGRGK